MKILLTNDDGIHAPGMQALIAAMPPDAQLTVVAPAEEKSATSHSISLGRKIHVTELDANGCPRYALNGTPADCVKFAISEIPGFKPDLIVSGINQGANTGVSVYYSGTISAAREGFINHIPALAISLCDRHFRDFEASQAITRRLVEAYFDGSIPKPVFLSVNVPPLTAAEVRGIRITKQAHSRFVEEFLHERLPGGEKLYTLAGQIEIMNADGKSDEEAVAEGYISITPLKLDLTDYDGMHSIKKWIDGVHGKH